MKTNRSWMLIVCMVLVVALCGTALGFAQGGALVPGVSAEAPSSSVPIPVILPEAGSSGAQEEGVSIGASGGLQLQEVRLDREEIPIGEELVVTLGASGCSAEHYEAQVTFIGLESGEKLAASSGSNPSGEELTLRVHLPVDGPADTYALRAVRFTAEGEEAAFYSRGYDGRAFSDPLLPKELSFTAIDPKNITLGESAYYLSDPELAPKLRGLSAGAKATVLYGSKDQQTYLAEAQVFSAAQEKALNLQFEDGSALWNFVSGAVKEPKEQDLEIRGEYGLSNLEELVGWETPHYAFRISGSGALPGTAVISLQVGQMSRFEGGGLYLYRYDEEKEELQLISGGVSAPEGVLTFQAVQRGVYLLCKGPAQMKQEVPLQQDEPLEYPPIDEGDTEWFVIRDRIDEASAGATVSVRIEQDEPIPYWIIRSLCGRDVRLSLSDGSTLVTLDGLSLDPPKRRPVFKLADLQQLVP